MLQKLKRFVDSENEAERYSVLKSLTIESRSWQESLLTWQILALIPTEREKARLAQSICAPEHPSSEWALISYLLFCEYDPQILESCILSLAASKNCSLFHRFEFFLANENHSEKVLFAYAIYAEETYNYEIAKYLEKSLSYPFPDLLKNRIFNLLMKLGIVSNNVVEVARNIFNEAINIDSKEQKSIFSEIFYLFFAGKKEDIENFNKKFNEIKNPELRRIIAWGLNEIEMIKEFKLADAEKFFTKTFTQKELNFTGYGCFHKKVIVEAVEKLTHTLDEEHNLNFTRSILSLADKECTEILAKSARFGLEKHIHSQNKLALSLWLKFSPINCSTFNMYIHNPKYYSIWRASYYKNIFVKFFEIDDFHLNKSAHSEKWQELFNSYLTQDLQSACELIYTQITALEKAVIKGVAQQETESFGRQIISNIQLCIAHFNERPSENGFKNNLIDTFIDQIYGTTIGGKLTTDFMTQLYQIVPFSGTSWAFTAIALTAPKLKLSVINAAIHRELEIIKKTLMDADLDKEEYILEVTSRFQSILVGSDRLKISVSQITLNVLKDVATLIQNILDNIEEKSSVALGKRNEETSLADSQEAMDWNGHIFRDRPILRWNAILQVYLNPHLTQEEKDYYENILKEGLRIAPHVEKRWVVRALVKLDTNDAIKAVLYHALQHIDHDFVEITARELLKSHHPRSQQALIRMVGKNTISDELKKNILNDIYIDNSGEILNELKTLQHLRLPQQVENALQNAITRALEKAKISENSSQKSSTKISSTDIDLMLKQFLPKLDTLSVEIRSALRTAEMILIQSQDWGNEAVDLSPIVNMHCKAVELMLRETFEAHTDAVIRKAALSKQLDLLGYGKGIADKMQTFEDYLGGLPVIRSIPYFSKYKLRKMLRAICLFQPGKRFTLDGPKAFALFLLVGSRKNCPFQLNDLFDLNFKDDNELFEFIKLIHLLQDSRNRAVHEGLTWEAKDEIETMRAQAYSIISKCIEISEFLIQKNREEALQLGVL